MSAQKLKRFFSSEKWKTKEKIRLCIDLAPHATRIQSLKFKPFAEPEKSHLQKNKSPPISPTSSLHRVLMSVKDPSNDDHRLRMFSSTDIKPIMSAITLQET